MMKKNRKVSILFWLYKSRGVEATAPLWCRISIQGQRYNFSLNCNVLVKEWNQENQTLNRKSKDARYIADIIETTRTEVRLWSTKLQLEGIEPTCTLFKQERETHAEDYHSLLSLFDYHATVEKTNLRKSTLELYQVTRRHIEKFLPIKYKKRDIDVKEIKKDFAPEFVAYLQGWKRDPKEPVCHNNGAMKHIERIHRLLNIAEDNEWVQKNVISSYKKKLKKSKRGFLDIEEVREIINQTNLPGILDIVRDCFIFSVYTGICWIDCRNLTKNQIVTGIDGKKWLSYARYKTEQPVMVPLLQPAEEVLNKYADYSRYNKRNRALPLPSNQVCNRSLKVIAKKACIEKNVTFHMARHTFATTIALFNNVPIETVSSMLGHTKISTTQIYAKVTGKKISEDTKKLRALYNTDEMDNRKTVNE